MAFPFFLLSSISSDHIHFNHRHVLPPPSAKSGQNLFSFGFFFSLNLNFFLFFFSWLQFFLWLGWALNQVGICVGIIGLKRDYITLLKLEEPHPFVQTQPD
ncbi:hypothetical protein BGX38DRAFT_460004 [Terfezia claveryi]|nr:hypothetical protein BGX38DRAFT_460004 [Terfezia claveryi]